MTPTPGATAPTTAPPAAPIAAPSATRGLLAHAPRTAVLASVKARKDLRIALSPVQLSCRNMRTVGASAGDGACYKRRNDDGASSFRLRDNASGRVHADGVKPLFNRLDSLREQRQMKATIFHNPMCGTSRKTLEILRDSGCDVWGKDYMKHPPS